MKEDKKKVRDLRKERAEYNKTRTSLGIILTEDDDDISRLEECKNITSLDINHRGSASIDLSIISEIPSLRRFRLQVLGTGKVVIPRESSVAFLKLHNRFPVDYDVSPFQGWKNLQQIDCFGNVYSDNTEFLRQSTVERKSIVKHFENAIFDLSPLSGNECLRQINISTISNDYAGHSSWTSIYEVKLPSCPNLRVVDLDRAGIQVLDIEPLTRCESLEVLIITNQGLIDFDFAQLGQMKSLRVLDLRACFRYSKDYLDSSFLKELPNLEVMHTSGIGFKSHHGWPKKMKWESGFREEHEFPYSLR